jgi:hypothetical protein
LRIVHDRVRKLFREMREPSQIGATDRVLTVVFPDGSSARHEFADADVLAGYVDGRLKFGRAKFRPLKRDEEDNGNG